MRIPLAEFLEVAVYTLSGEIEREVGAEERANDVPTVAKQKPPSAIVVA
jgi:hypothetical protein